MTALQPLVLMQAVKRHLNRLPSDFWLQLASEECANLRSQTVTSSASHGGRRTAPYAFTEQGVAMLSNPDDKSSKKNAAVKAAVQRKPR